MNKINTRNIGNKSYLFCRIPGHRQSLADIYSPATLASQKLLAQMLIQTNHSSLWLRGTSIFHGHHHPAPPLLSTSGQTWEEVIGTWFSVIFICLSIERLKKRILPFSMDFPHDLG